MYLVLPSAQLVPGATGAVSPTRGQRSTNSTPSPGGPAATNNHSVSVTVYGKDHEVVVRCWNIMHADLNLVAH